MSEHTSGYTIESGVPLPKGGRNPKYPWTEMRAGNSVVIPWVDGKDRGRFQQTVAGSARQWLQRNHPEWRSVTKFVNAGVRVWFVEADGDTP